MRAYFFGNMYLSSIQQGIQAQHTTAEMFTRYTFNDDQSAMLHEWATDHKTSILLNAGYSENIHELVRRFDDLNNPFPWADFHESEEALDGALTCVGIILPEKIYETASYIRSLPFRKRDDVIASIQNTGSVDITKDGSDVVYELTKWEFDLVQELNNYGMAK